MRRAPSDIESSLRQITRLQNAPGINHAHDRVDGVLLETFQLPKMHDRDEHAIDVEGVESLARAPATDIGMKTFAGFDQRRQPLKWPSFGGRLHLPNDGGETLFFDGQIA